MNFEGHEGIRVLVIKGTVRPDSYTGKALDLVLDELGRHDEVAFKLFDPADTELPFPGQTGHPDRTQSLRSAAEASTGLILATPEYHGSYSATMKLIIENLGFPSVLSGKPIGLLGVAAGQIGAIKALEHLRSVCSHVGAIVLPGPVSVAGVRQVFDESGRCLDPAAEKRIRSVVSNLIDYVHQRICPGIALEAMVRDDPS